MSKPRAQIRDLAPSDEGAWRGLWQGYLTFYQQDLAPEVTEATWRRLLDPVSPMAARVAEVEGKILAFANHMHHPSSWAPGDDAYLEDLFVAPDARGLGLGRALIDDLIALARARGWHRLYWHTHRGNERARALYDSYLPADEMVRYRMRL